MADLKILLSYLLHVTQAECRFHGRAAPCYLTNLVIPFILKVDKVN